MTEEFKIQSFFNRYLGSPNETRLSQPLITVLQTELLKGSITASNIVETLVQELDSIRMLNIERANNNTAPPPIIIAPETEEGKALLRSIIEMQNKKT